jgi:hypothetical protein
MRVLLLLSFCTLLMAQSNTKVAAGANNSSVPEYTADGRLIFPANYREWIYLTTGIDMDYNPDLMAMDHSMFDNVFVNPEAYKAFVATGTWPDKTMLVLEGRMATGKGSINKKGQYQTTDVMARSIHIKDASHFPGKWAFVEFDGDIGRTLPKEAECYSCHAQHGAVDTTFVQFYPTLLEIAKRKGTLAAGYLKEETANTSDGTKKNH